MEIWRVVREFPTYEVSSEGRIRRRESHRPITPRKNQRGFLFVTFHSGKHYGRGLAQVVATEFVGPPQGNQNVVINRNGDRNDCRAENLAWSDRRFANKFFTQFYAPYLYDPIRIHCLSTGEIFTSWSSLIEQHVVLSQDVMWNCAMGTTGVRPNDYHYADEHLGNFNDRRYKYEEDRKLRPWRYDD